MAPIALPPAALPGQVRLVQRQRQQAVVAQPVVIVDVLIAQRQSEHPLPKQAPQRVLHTRRIAVVNEAGCQPPSDLECLVGSSQQHGTAIGREAPAVELGNHVTASQARQRERIRSTLCRHGHCSLRSVN